MQPEANFAERRSADVAHNLFKNKLTTAHQRVSTSIDSFPSIRPRTAIKITFGLAGAGAAGLLFSGCGESGSANDKTVPPTDITPFPTQTAIVEQSPIFPTPTVTFENNTPSAESNPLSFDVNQFSIVLPEGWKTSTRKDDKNYLIDMLENDWENTHDIPVNINVMSRTLAADEDLKSLEAELFDELDKADKGFVPTVSTTEIAGESGFMITSGVLEDGKISYIKEFGFIKNNRFYKIAARVIDFRGNKDEVRAQYAIVDNILTTFETK